MSSKKASNPRFLKGIPRLVVPKKIPTSKDINPSKTMTSADHTQREDLSNSGYHSSVKPNRGKAGKVSFGDF